VLAGLFGLARDTTEPRKQVESLLRDHFGARDVLLLDGGTSALALSLSGAVRELPGRPVALPAYGCFDIATAAITAGAPVVLYDTDPATLAPEPESFQSALDQRPAAVVLAHLYGIPIDIPRLADRVRAVGALLIEDAAQGSGASLAGLALGSFGDVGILSFGRGKGVTGGGGGALIACTERGSRIVAAAGTGLAPGVAGVREMVMLCAQWLLGRPGAYRVPASLPFLHLGETVYRSPHPARGTPRASLRVLMRTWPLGAREAEQRRANAQRLSAQRGPGLRFVGVPADARAGYLRLPVLAAPNVRPKASTSAARRLGIVSGYPMPLSLLPGFRDLLVKRDEPLAGAHRLAVELVTLPTHAGLAEVDLRRIESWMDKVNGAAL
jgi:perosamine synthetase